MVFFGAGIRVADLDAALPLPGRDSVLLLDIPQRPDPAARASLVRAGALGASSLRGSPTDTPAAARARISILDARRYRGQLRRESFRICPANSLSVAPAAALFCWFTLIGYLTAFSLLRDLAGALSTPIHGFRSRLLR